MTDFPVPVDRAYSWKEFLESVPPGKSVTLIDATKTNFQGQLLFRLPIVELHCSTIECDGRRFWDARNEISAPSHTPALEFITYKCKNCGSSQKHYAIKASKTSAALYSVQKIGEMPSFGPPLPSRLITLLRDDRDYLFKGRRAENQGLGIGAFAYYRRVIENQKNKIFEAVIEVAKSLPATDNLIAELEAAKKETQFSKGVERIKSGLPPVLLISGNQNPLILLHDALSHGLHEQTDSSCLELATDVRIVLTELADRISIALHNSTELHQAVARLRRKETSSPSGKSP